MAYLVIAYPRISDTDFSWIQEQRRQFDKRFFEIVEPHITLVFAVEDTDQAAFVAEVRNRAAGVKSFDFEMKVATINRDFSGTYYHEFLVPDTGYADFVKLHDRLYSGELGSHLRLDIDYIPHIGIGNDEDPLVVKQRVDVHNANGILIKGNIAALDIIEFASGVVRTVESVPLE